VSHLEFLLSAMGNPNRPQRYAAERRSNMGTAIGEDNKISSQLNYI